MPSPITLRTAGDERNGETIHLHPGGFPQGWVIRHQPARAPDQTPAGLSGGQRSVSKYPHNLALDLYTHSLVAFRLTLVSDTSVDVAMLLRDVMMPLPLREDWGQDMEWPYPGIPASLVASFAGHKVAALPFFAPETVTTDHGSVYRLHTSRRSAKYTFGGDGLWCQMSRIRWRSRAKPARPYIWRLSILVLVLTDPDDLRAGRMVRRAPRDDRAPSGARWGRATAAWADRGADARCASIVPSSAGSADATSRQAPNGAMHVSVLIADNAACGRRMRPPKDEAPAHDYAAPRPGLVLTASEAVCLVARASLASDPAGLSISSLSGS